MISIHHQITARRIWLCAAGLLLLLVVARIITQTVHATSSESRSGRHVLTVYDSGHEVGLLTEADTLREALAEANITLAANDVTEPSLDEELVAASYKVNIYRARPVTVVDGKTQTKVMTPYQTAAQIAKQAGVTLHAEDRVSREYADDVLMAGSLERMIIDRATEVKLVFYGKRMTVYTHAETVGEMLEERSITPSPEDTVSVKLTTPIRAGMTIELWRDGTQTVTVDEAVDYPVKKIEDADRPVGYHDIKKPGVKGEKTVTYEIEMRNGKEVSRKAIKTVVTKKPVEQVEVVGVQSSSNPLTKSMGVNNYRDSKGVVHRETYYDLPMNVVMSYCGGGKYTVRADGAKVDKDGYILVAANLANYPRCSIVETSMGLGKVYDTGGFAAIHPHGFDLATDWTRGDGV